MKEEYDFYDNDIARAFIDESTGLLTIQFIKPADFIELIPNDVMQLLRIELDRLM